MFEVRLAPMCGITDHIFRSLCYEQGCDLAYTEMISALGYLCAPQQKATQELMKRGPDEPRLIIQLFGRDPDIVSKAAGYIGDLGLYDGIDLNMGCPAKKIAPSGEGCGLMRTPETARDMIRKTVKNTYLPVSVKMRLGYDRDHINVIDFARMAEEAGASSITVHGRTREQQYSGEADWDMIAEVKEKVSIPVYGNGDIYDVQQAINKQAQSGTDGIMIGRGAMGNPWIFREIKDVFNGHEPQKPFPEERKRMILRHYRMMLEEKPAHMAVREMRKHIGWYVRGMKGAAGFRAKINCCTNPDTAMNLVNEFFSGMFSQEKDEQEEL